MLRVKKRLALIRFNTLYVIGSKLLTKNAQRGTEFQYIICNRFKKMKLLSFLQIERRFNTLYVIGSI